LDGSPKTSIKKAVHLGKAGSEENLGKYDDDNADKFSISLTDDLSSDGDLLCGVSDLRLYSKD
jgi:hypothetical protein